MSLVPTQEQKASTQGVASRSFSGMKVIKSAILDRIFPVFSEAHAALRARKKI